MQHSSGSRQGGLRIDPQHRLLLEVAWEALEDAGLPPLNLAGRPVGVFVGVCTVDYGEIQKRDPASMNSYTNAGGSGSLAANRISYHLDLRGPSVSVDTACSSSLVTLHLGCESLRRGEAEMVLVGGVHLLLNPAATVGFCKASMLSQAGHCRAFDARADGFVRAEGAGVVVLALCAGPGERRSDLRGHPRHWRQPGRPNQWHLPAKRGVATRPAQAGPWPRAHGAGGRAVRRSSWHGHAGRRPHRVSGPGRRPWRRPGASNPCRIGSVKTNIGHLEGPPAWRD